MQRSNTRDQIKERQEAISAAEASVERMHGLASELRTLAGDIEEKKLRLDKLKADLKNGNFDERLNEKSSKARGMEDKRDVLNSELRGLSLQADSRARLDIKRSETKSKKAEVQNILDMCKSKFRKLVGAEPRAETMEREIDRISREKDQELGEAEEEAATANKNLQHSETMLSQAKSQAKTKRDELKAAEKRLKDVTGGVGLEEALKEAQSEIADLSM
ncbi:hypothetical protein BJ138DRAFT_881107 [Hygrophoropsis aurantiaca]|uniref:Uncharacterized protein n=1 Tax=Hygrophoropsis aurantiaca TaxID=72124 RepID=A0ACB8ASW2_9AGAM|nr:hypothetical protein BJ138DRAFT_881107 [Hygrophoropsis aurantiaca]